MEVTAVVWLDWLGTVVFAISGALAAHERRFDLFGALVLGVVTAAGGGTLRDFLLGQGPVSWIQRPEYLYVSAGAAGATFLGALRLRVRPQLLDSLEESKKLLAALLQSSDALGLGAFAVIGVQKAMLAGTSLGVCVVMGICSATFGGAIRDVLIGKVPNILRQEIYATAAGGGALVYVALERFHVSGAALVGLGVTFGARMLALRFAWRLPGPGWEQIGSVLESSAAQQDG